MKKIFISPVLDKKTWLAILFTSLFLASSLLFQNTPIVAVFVVIIYLFTRVITK